MFYTVVIEKGRRVESVVGFYSKKESAELRMNNEAESLLHGEFAKMLAIWGEYDFGDDCHMEKFTHNGMPYIVIRGNNDTIYDESLYTLQVKPIIDS